MPSNCCQGAASLDASLLGFKLKLLHYCTDTHTRTHSGSLLVIQCLSCVPKGGRMYKKSTRNEFKRISNTHTAPKSALRTLCLTHLCWKRDIIKSNTNKKYTKAKTSPDPFFFFFCSRSEKEIHTKIQNPTQRQALSDINISGSYVAHNPLRKKKILLIHSIDPASAKSSQSGPIEICAHLELAARRL